MSEMQIHRARVDTAGRIVIPADERRRLGINLGDEVIVQADERGLRITTAEQAIRDAQALFAPYKKPGESVVDELIRERREEALLE